MVGGGRAWEEAVALRVLRVRPCLGVCWRERGGGESRQDVRRQEIKGGAQAKPSQPRRPWQWGRTRAAPTGHSERHFARATLASLRRSERSAGLARWRGRPRHRHRPRRLVFSEQFACARVPAFACRCSPIHVLRGFAFQWHWRRRTGLRSATCRESPWREQRRLTARAECGLRRCRAARAPACIPRRPRWTEK